MTADLYNTVACSFYFKKLRGECIIQKENIQLETLTCPSCLQKIENAVGGLKGIDKESLKVIFNASRVKVNFNDEESSIVEIEKVIQDLGYVVKKSRVKAV